MKPVQKISTLIIALFLLWLLKSQMHLERSRSMDSYLLYDILPVLEDAVTRYIPVRNGEKNPSAQRYRSMQDLLSCSLDVVQDLRSHRSQKRVKSLCLGKFIGIDIFCALIPSKKILFVGPETTFYLHANLLKAHELYENRSHSCLGAEFCTFHQICLGSRSSSSSEPFHLGRFKKYPNNRELATSQSAILRFILSNSLYMGSDSRDGRYTDPIAQINRESGVRRKEKYWVGRARKADVLVLNRGPLPAPAWTYDGTKQGNWSFVNSYPGNTLREKILTAALRVTVDTFLPETVETLKKLSKEFQTKTLWHGSWYVEPECAVDSRKGILDSDLDPWTLYHNAQVYLHNHLLRSLLPHYGVLFVPMSSTFGLSRQRSMDTEYPIQTIFDRKDCLRHGFGSVREEGMRNMLLQGMSLILEN